MCVRSKFAKAMFAVVGLPLLSPLAHATVLQFENVVQPGTTLVTSGSIYQESNFTLANNNAMMWTIVSASYSGALNYGPSSTSDFYSDASLSTVALTEQQGHKFSLNSIDVGFRKFSGDGSGGIVRFHGEGMGSSFDYGFELTDQNWHTLSFSNDPNFQNLYTLTIKFDSNGGALDSFALDNINVSKIPVPAAAYLFGSGLIGLGGIVRSRKAR